MDTQQAFINLFASFYRSGFTEAQSCSNCAEQDLSDLSISKAKEFYQQHQPLIENLGIYAFLYESELTFTKATKE
ncbi:hypothetical protein [Flectobacillus roseus]|uniref:Uncharacterized protein n=1 Tax=Flectobacillus roseus TaxID=502259 RepID=A0ABT6Y5Z6_9BACT|nr:hypothetical protein [Flectobacillus roseus]MDI9858957.1 hypothetical protein [Flectobacillus roseus]